MTKDISNFFTSTKSISKLVSRIGLCGISKILVGFTLRYIFGTFARAVFVHAKLEIIQ